MMTCTKSNIVLNVIQYRHTLDSSLKQLYFIKVSDFCFQQDNKEPNRVFHVYHIFQFLLSIFIHHAIIYLFSCHFFYNCFNIMKTTVKSNLVINLFIMNHIKKHKLLKYLDMVMEGSFSHLQLLQTGVIIAVVTQCTS